MPRCLDLAHHLAHHFVHKGWVEHRVRIVRSLFTLRKPRSLLLVNGEPGFLRENRLWTPVVCQLECQ